MWIGRRCCRNIEVSLCIHTTFCAKAEGGRILENDDIFKWDALEVKWCGKRPEGRRLVGALPAPDSRPLHLPLLTGASPGTARAP